jgi:nucleotide-binding universal stress UspA family protein
MNRLDKILFAADFSFTSEYALGYAFTLANQFHAKLIVFHVINVSLELCRNRESGPELERHREQIADTVRERLAGFCSNRLRYWTSTHGTDPCKLETCTAFGRPCAEILKKAREEGAGLLIIGTHSRGVIDPCVVGSTAKKVVEEATCPFITVRPPFWMLCMKFRNNPELPLSRTAGSFVTVR